ncbi:MAG: hypothetical protein E7562_05620 [Ruminococcaceae bacterium]|nr:hypothetical protein [Oscillospiraceae bacterium]
MKITFSEFKNFFKKNGYADSDIAILFKGVKGMQPKTKRWLIKWFFTGELPTEKVEEVTVEYLINECGYKPVNAFIIIDWLMTEPDYAKYILLKQTNERVISDETKQEMLEILNGMGAEPEVITVDETEDIEEK